MPGNDVSYLYAPEGKELQAGQEGPGWGDVGLVNASEQEPPHASLSVGKGPRGQSVAGKAVRKGMSGTKPTGAKAGGHREMTPREMQQLADEMMARHHAMAAAQLAAGPSVRSDSVGQDMSGYQSAQPFSDQVAYGGPAAEQTQAPPAWLDEYMKNQ